MFLQVERFSKPRASWIFDMALVVKEMDGGVAFFVKVVPGSSRTRIAGVLQSALKVNIAAAPEKGRANKELVRFLAGLVNRPRSATTIASGRTANHKEIHISGLTKEQLNRSLARYLG